MELKKFDKAQLAAFYEDCKAQYTAYQAQDLKLDMSRGKPSPKQLDLSRGLLDCISEADLNGEAGDYRNYGLLDGIPEAKALFAPMLGVETDELFMFGNASLQAMYLTISYAYSHGLLGNTPWNKLDSVKFLCPVPGYDRHFSITQFFGAEMINIPMNEDGPDMDMVEKLVAEDASTVTDTVLPSAESAADAVSSISAVAVSVPDAVTSVVTVEPSADSVADATPSISAVAVSAPTVCTLTCTSCD